MWCNVGNWRFELGPFNYVQGVDWKPSRRKGMGSLMEDDVAVDERLGRGYTIALAHLRLNPRSRHESHLDKARD